MLGRGRMATVRQMAQVITAGDSDGWFLRTQGDAAVEDPGLGGDER